MKQYFIKLYGLLKDKKVLYAILFLLLIINAVVLKYWIKDPWLFRFLVAFVVTYLIQLLLLQKKNYFLYICRLILFVLIAVQAKYIIFPQVENMKVLGYATELDPIVGSKWASNLQQNPIIALWKNDTIYAITISTDSLGRRIAGNTSFNDSDTVEHEKHAIFLGCSFTFGECLDYSSTIPFLFQQSNSTYTSYNYGQSGWGPHQTALLFDNGINTLNCSAIKENKGFALYTFIDDHLNRVYGSSRYLLWEHGDSHDVYVENDSLIVKARSKFQLREANIFNSVGLFKMFHSSFSYPKSEKFYQRFADIVNYIAKKYWEIYPDNKFYVAITPNEKQPDLEWTKYLVKNIEMINVGRPSDYTQNYDKYAIKHDGHPTKAYNEYFVEKISEVIDQEEINKTVKQ